MSAAEIAKRLAKSKLPCPACDCGGSDCLCTEYAYSGKQMTEDVDWLLARLEKCRDLLALSNKNGEWGDADLQDTVDAFLKEDEDDQTPLAIQTRHLTKEVMLLGEELRSALWGLEQLKDISAVAQEALYRVRGTRRAFKNGVQP